MAVSVEAAKRELSGAVIDIFKLRAAALVGAVEGCKTMMELRQFIFLTMDDVRTSDPEKAARLLAAWGALNEE